MSKPSGPGRPDATRREAVSHLPPYVAPVADQLIAGLHPDRLRLLLALARRDHTLLGWVALARTPSWLVGHWATVQHLQTHPAHRGRGIGSALMRRLQQLARDELGCNSCTWRSVAAWGWRGSTRVWAGVRSAVGPARCAWLQARTAMRC